MPSTAFSRLVISLKSWLCLSFVFAVTLFASDSFAKDSGTLTFEDEKYILKNSASAPGEATDELREYLRDGEDFDGYVKMLALHGYSSELKGDAAQLAQATLDQTKKTFPDSYLKELLLEPNHAVILMIIVNGNDVELSLFDYVKTGETFTSAQFVLRNKPPYETQAKFKTEQDAHFDEWLKDLARISLQTPQLLKATKK